MSKYEVKNVKYHRGHEGEPLAECALYRDGVKVAVYSDGDWGGEANFWWVDKDAPRVEVKGVNFSGKPLSYQGTPEEALLMAHCAAIPPTDSKYIKGEKNYTTPDIFVSDLAADYDNNKRFAKICKTQTMFRVIGQPKGEYKVLKAPFSQQAKEWIANKYGSQVEEIYNEKIGQVAV
jgi:hypothetical protein